MHIELGKNAAKGFSRLFRCGQGPKRPISRWIQIGPQETHLACRNREAETVEGTDGPESPRRALKLLATVHSWARTYSGGTGMTVIQPSPPHFDLIQAGRWRTQEGRILKNEGLYADNKSHMGPASVSSDSDIGAEHSLDAPGWRPESRDILATPWSREAVQRHGCDCGR